MKVAVIGAAGYAGGELLRLLLQHPEVTDCVATSRSQAGKPIARRASGARAASPTPASRARPRARSRAGADVVFLCLEHGESSRVAGEVFDAGPGLVVDLAADFRVQDPELYERYYGAAPRAGAGRPLHLRPGRRRRLPAPRRHAPSRRPAASPRRRSSRSIRWRAPASTSRRRSSPSPGRAAPGCSPGRRRTIRRGRTTSSPTRCWATGTRRRCCSRWREWVGRPDATARLMTHSGPFVRGIYLTLHAFLPADVRDHGRRAGTAAACWFRDAYAGRPFVRVLDAPPELTHAVGTNYALIHAAESEDGREVQVTRRDRQPGQGRRRPGDPGDEPGARPRRARRAHGRGDVSMLNDALDARSPEPARAPATGAPSRLRPDAGPPGARPRLLAGRRGRRRVARRLRRPRGRLHRAQPPRRGARHRRAGGGAAVLLHRGAACRSARRWPRSWPSSVPSRWAGCFFCNSGAEANENALHLARRHTGRQTIVSVRGRLARPHRGHARRAPTAPATRRRRAGPACRSRRKVPFDDVAALDAAVDDTRRRGASSSRCRASPARATARPSSSRRRAGSATSAARC